MPVSKTEEKELPSTLSPPPSVSALDDDLCQWLKSDSSTQQTFVMIQRGTTVYWGLFLANGPLTPVFQFIHGVFEVNRDHSFFILRQRLWVCGVVTEFCEQVVKVCAKRISKSELSDMLERVRVGLETSQFIRISPPSFPKNAWPLLSEVYLPAYDDEKLSRGRFVEKLAAQVERTSVLHDSNWPIGAAVFFKNKILSVGRNQSFAVKTQHAEVQMVLRWYLQTGQLLPRGCEVWVTHKPCRMCAGLLRYWSEDGADVNVCFLQDVTGGLSNHQILTGMKHIQSQ